MSLRYFGELLPRSPFPMKGEQVAGVKSEHAVGLAFLIAEFHFVNISRNNVHDRPDLASRQTEFGQIPHNYNNIENLDFDCHAFSLLVPTNHPTISFTTFPYTSVSLKSRPACRYVNFV